jgi:hypothetical protein
MNWALLGKSTFVVDFSSLKELLQGGWYLVGAALAANRGDKSTLLMNYTLLGKSTFVVDFSSLNNAVGATPVTGNSYKGGHLNLL